MLREILLKKANNLYKIREHLTDALKLFRLVGGLEGRSNLYLGPRKSLDFWGRGGSAEDWKVLRKQKLGTSESLPTKGL